jgi:hypothetical protein
MRSIIGTEICGSSCLGVTISPRMPSMSIARYKSGDSGELIKKRAMLPAMPRLLGGAEGSTGGVP